MTNNQQCETYNRIKVVLVEQGNQPLAGRTDTYDIAKPFFVFFADNHNKLINF